MIAGLVDIRKVKDYIDLATTGAEDTTFDSWITDAVAMASSELVRYCNQPIALGTRTVIFDGSGYEWYALPHFPIVTFTSLENRGSITDAWATVGTTYYELDSSPASGAACRLYMPGGFSVGTRNYRATYTSGYAEIPDEIERVVVEMVAILWKESMRAGGEARLGVTNISHNSGGGSVSKSISPPIDRWRGVLNSYRVRVV